MAAAMLVMSVPTIGYRYCDEGAGRWREESRSWYRDATGNLIRNVMREEDDSVPASEYRGKRNVA